MKNRETEKIAAFHKDYNEFVKRAIEAVNKYEFGGKYDSTNDDVCLYIMDMQIYALRKINADYIHYANNERGLKLKMHPDRFYTEFIKAAVEHRDKLKQKIKEDKEKREFDLDILTIRAEYSIGRKIIETIKEKWAGYKNKKK